MLSKREKQYWLSEYGKSKFKEAFDQLKKECIKCYKERPLDKNRVCSDNKCQKQWEKEGDYPF